MTNETEFGRLVLTRRIGESVIVELPDGRDFYVTLVETRSGQAKLMFTAPKDVRIRREELPSRRAS